MALRRAGFVMLALVLAGVGGLAVHSAWVLSENSDSLAGVERRATVGELYHAAEVALLEAEAAGTRFDSSRDTADRQQLETAVDEAILALAEIAAVGEAQDLFLVSSILSEFAAQVDSLPALLDAIVAGEELPQGFDVGIVRSVTERLESRHVEVRAETAAVLSDFRSSQSRQVAVAFVLFGLGVPTVIVLLTMLARYQKREYLAELKLARLDSISRTDGLTGVGNLRAFREYLDEQSKSAREQNSSLSVAILDIDFFKRINDENGHPEGDAVLAKFALALQGKGDYLAESAAAFRIGGDEFALVLPETNEEDARRVLQEIRRRVMSELDDISFSAGIASQVGGDVNPRALRNHADDALYFAKRTGRDRVFGFSQSRVLERRTA